MNIFKRVNDEVSGSTEIMPDRDDADCDCYDDTDYTPEYNCG